MHNHIFIKDTQFKELIIEFINLFKMFLYFLDAYVGPMWFEHLTWNGKQNVWKHQSLLMPLSAVFILRQKSLRCILMDHRPGKWHRTDCCGWLSYYKHWEMNVINVFSDIENQQLNDSFRRIKQVFNMIIIASLKPVLFRAPVWSSLSTGITRVGWKEWEFIASINTWELIC